MSNNIGHFCQFITVDRWIFLLWRRNRYHSDHSRDNESVFPVNRPHTRNVTSNRHPIQLITTNHFRFDYIVYTNNGIPRCVIAYHFLLVFEYCTHPFHKSLFLATRLTYIASFTESNWTKPIRLPIPSFLLSFLTMVFFDSYRFNMCILQKELFQIIFSSRSL